MRKKEKERKIKNDVASPITIFSLFFPSFIVVYLDIYFLHTIADIATATIPLNKQYIESRV
jgi:hypothetical protein